jgi:predicted RNase H-like nuclease (RuvC/YqgF family)
MNNNNNSPASLYASMGSLYKRLAELHLARARNLEAGRPINLRNREIEIQQEEIRDAKHRLVELKEQLEELGPMADNENDWMASGMALLRNAAVRNLKQNIQTQKNKLGIRGGNPKNLQKNRKTRRQTRRNQKNRH